MAKSRTGERPPGADDDSGFFWPDDEDTGPATLDDLLALLLSLDPEDEQELCSVATTIRCLIDAEEDQYSRSLLSDATQKIDAVSRGETPDPPAYLTEAARLIGLANRGKGNESLRLQEEEAGQGTVTDPGRKAEPTASEVNLELLREFVDEGLDCMGEAEAALLELESDPENADSINTVFRSFHTLKGTASFLGFDRISRLAHDAESMLSQVRSGEVRFTTDCADLAFKSADMLKALINLSGDLPGAEGEFTQRGYEELLEGLKMFSVGLLTGGTSSRPSGGGKISQTAVSLEDKNPAELNQVTAVSGKTGKTVRVESRSETTQVRSPHDEITNPQSDDPSIRVSTERLDRLLDYLGELVIAQTMVVQEQPVRSGQFQSLSRKVSHEGKIVRELQNLSMGLRMVPLKATFQKIARLVRDVARRCGKPVNFETSGSDTEIDRFLVDKIKDPLIHMVRNAIDHGIEISDIRLKQGKNEVGTLRLSAFHASGHVVIELSDDGAGLDVERIATKALKKGLIHSEKGLSKKQITNLIFKPGFSTVEEISALSGRGVGMDIVKRNVESLNGRIDLSSEAGVGTTVSLHLPITLGITDGMVARVGKEKYIIPINDISMSYKPGPASLATVAGRGEMVLVRDTLIPIIRLHQLFDIAEAEEEVTKGLLVVIDAGRGLYAVLVDELLGQQQVVVKALPIGKNGVTGFNGCAILSDGKVGLIIDGREIRKLGLQGGCRGLEALAVCS